MNMFWDQGPMFVKDLIERFPDPKPHFNTVSTFVRLMEKKGYVAHEKLGNSFRYSPNISRDDYSAIALNEVLKRYFNGSAKLLISALVKEARFTDDEIWELMSQLRQARKE